MARRTLHACLTLPEPVRQRICTAPFGQFLSSAGTIANENPFRFSSEVYDPESQLVYYNYRYYSPSLGRWLSRDPIEEQGGLNLYAIVGNNAVNTWDDVGLAKISFECCDSFPDTERIILGNLEFLKESLLIAELILKDDVNNDNISVKNLYSTDIRLK